MAFGNGFGGKQKISQGFGQQNLLRVIAGGVAMPRSQSANIYYSWYL
jgi:hypothetical protein